MLAKATDGVEDWAAFFSRCMQDHVEFELFPKELNQQKCRLPLSGQAVFEAWTTSRDQGMLARALVYLELLLQSGIVTDAHVLQYVCSSIGTTLSMPEKYTSRFGYKRTLEGALLERLCFQMLHHNSTTAGPDVRVVDLRIAKPLAILLDKFCNALEGAETLNGPPQDIGTALGQYVEAYIRELSRAGLLTSKEGEPSKYLQGRLGRYLSPFIALISTINAELGQTLDILQKQSGLDLQSLEALVNDGVNSVDINALTYQDNILDTPLIITRAALYIYLNAMLSGRPICDDAALFNYLNSRYNDEIPTLVTDLITASFDVLANAINRTESSGSIFLYKSFLINKMPVLLESYSTMIFPPLSIEICITQALNRMDPPVDPADPYSTQSLDLPSEDRSEFLFACALYQLIPEQSIEAILGDVPMQSLPEGGKYAKVDLVAQCTANSGKIEDLVSELENMEGNAAEIARALTEIIQSLCATKDSITLKTICNALSRKPRSLDILMLFCQPRDILQPLCDLLDHWQVHEDQGEHHPVYDEFGSIFLLILVLRHHFSLPDSDLGIGYSDSFVLKYIRTGRNARDPSDLTEHENQLLGGWIKGLFETEGISDELVSTCSPQDFHLLVATLFDQSLKACEAGVLGVDTLKGGFEYLLEPFLLPSLIAGLSLFAHRLIAPSPPPPFHIIFPALSLLIHPPSLSSDSAALHAAVLAVAAPTLSLALASVQKHNPRRQDIDPLLATLKAYTRPPRCAIASQVEFEAWCNTPNGSVLATLQNAVLALVAWSTTGASNAAPPSYTHRMLLFAIGLRGAKAVLDALLDAIMKTATNGAPDIALDVVTAMICAPSAPDGRGRLSLRHALHAASSDAYTLSKRNAGRAEIVLRLLRRVEAQGGRSENGAVGGEMDVGDVGGQGEEILLLGDGTGEGGGHDGEGMDGMEGMGIGMDLGMGNVFSGGKGDDLLGF